MHILRRLSVWMLVLMTAATAVFCGIPVTAEDSLQKTVKVGYFSNGGFMHKDANGDYEGYDVEYYYTLAQYAGWNIEFIDFDTLSEAEDALSAGRIDMLSGMSKTTAREEKFLFSDAKMCTTKTAIQVRQDDDRFSLTNHASLENLQCGIVKGSVIEALYQNWCAAQGLTPHIVSFTSAAERDEALQNGTIDAVAAGSTVSGAQKIAEFPAFDLFFLMNQNSVSLKQELDSAMAVLSLESPNFQEALMEIYFPTTRNSQPSFSKEEKEYIAAHPIVHVGLLSDDVPFSSGSSGSMKGYFAEYYAHLSVITGINFECDAYADVDALYDALKDEKIDIIGRAEKDAYNAYGREVAQTNSFLSSGIVQIIRVGTSSVQTGAVPKYNERIVSAIQQDISSSITLKTYANNEECFAALNKKEVDVIYMSAAASNYYLNHNRSTDYVVTSFGDADWDVAMCVSLGREGNTLRSILNKTLAVDNQGINKLISADMVKDNSNLHTVLSQMPVSTIISLGLITFGLLVIVAVALFIILRRRKAEMKLAAQQAEVAADLAASKARHAFFGTVSHDMRTPLNGILGFTDLALKCDDPSTIKEYLEKIHISGETLNLLVNDTLLMSRMENNKYVLTPSPVNLAELMPEVLLPIKQVADAKKIKFIDEASKVCTGWYNIDQVSVQKVFMNLLTNAVKFSKPGGVVKFACIHQDNVFTFTVTDEGIGIDEKFQAHMFEPYSQEDAINSKSAGSGLGLSIVKNIVNAMHGDIMVYSKKNIGTTFIVKLPMQACEPASAGKELSASSLEKLKHKHVLVCEDNQLNREILIALLKKAEMEVTAAEDGKKGLERFKESPEGMYDFILMDLRMPVMDGFEAARQIRHLNRRDADKVIIYAVSADAFQENIQEALDAGMNGHIAKPINPDILLQTLAKAYTEERK